MQDVHILLGKDDIVLKSKLVSNPTLNISFTVNGQYVDPSWFTNITVSTINYTDYRIVQNVIITKRDVTWNTSGSYELKSCNVVGCKVDVWNIYIRCKSMHDLCMK